MSNFENTPLDFRSSIDDIFNSRVKRRLDSERIRANKEAFSNAKAEHEIRMESKEAAILKMRKKLEVAGLELPNFPGRNRPKILVSYQQLLSRKSPLSEGYTILNACRYRQQDFLCNIDCIETLGISAGETRSQYISRIEIAARTLAEAASHTPIAIACECGYQAGLISYALLKETSEMFLLYTGLPFTGQMGSEVREATINSVEKYLSCIEKSDVEKNLFRKDTPGGSLF